MSTPQALPPPVRPLRCQRSDCTLAVGGSCARQSEFKDPLSLCASLVRHPSGTPEDSALGAGTEPVNTALVTLANAPTADAGRSTAFPQDSAPWSGRHVLDAELEPLLARTPARLIALVGSFNAGKTALLTAFFLQLASGQKRGFPYRFASSQTLFAWHSLVEKANRWTGSKEEEIVTHTPKTLEQAQHLHLGLRPVSSTDDRHVDVLFSDLPGEWIANWVSLADAQNSRRLQFFARCDAFVHVLDASELIGERLRRFDAEQARMLLRLVDLERERTPRRPLLFLLCKWDAVLLTLGVPPEPSEPVERLWSMVAERLPRTWNALLEAQGLGLKCQIAAVAAFPHTLEQGQPVGVMAPFIWLMAQVDGRQPWKRLMAPIPEGASPFETLRRWEDDP